jgi:hypothetical protein
MSVHSQCFCVFEHFHKEMVGSMTDRMPKRGGEAERGARLPGPQLQDVPAP